MRLAMRPAHTGQRILHIDRSLLVGRGFHVSRPISVDPGPWSVVAVLYASVRSRGSTIRGLRAPRVGALLAPVPGNSTGDGHVSNSKRTALLVVGALVGLVNLSG